LRAWLDRRRGISRGVRLSAVLVAKSVPIERIKVTNSEKISHEVADLFREQAAQIGGLTMLVGFLINTAMQEPASKTLIESWKAQIEATEGDNMRGAKDFALTILSLHQARAEALQ
jgi:hypothetical protein